MIKKEKEQLFDGIRVIFKEELREGLKEVYRILAIHTETIAAIMVDVTIIKEDVASIKKTLFGPPGQSS